MGGLRAAEAERRRPVIAQPPARVYTNNVAGAPTDGAPTASEATD
ncbi:hypothetical protein THAOC_05608, partial [Thalassiosira oceanica]